MQKIATFVLGAVLVGANLAHAVETGVRPAGDSADRNDHHRRISRTLMSCRFVGIGVPLPPPLPPLPGKGLGKDPTTGLPGVAPIGAPGMVPGAPLPGAMPGAVPGPFPGFGPVGGPLPPPGVGLPLPGGPVVGPVPLMNNCAAVARLVDRDRSRDDGDWDDDRFFRNEFAVSCEGVPVYADTAVRTRIDGFEFLTGVVGDPILKLVRDHAFDDYGYTDRDEHDHDRDRRSGIVPAWLAIRGRIMEGFCAIEKKYHREGDGGGHSSSIN